MAGVTQAEFCARHGIHPTTFSTWCRAPASKATGADTPCRGVKFAEFKMPSGGALPIEVELPNGVRIRLRDAGLCRELLPVCMQACAGRPVLRGVLPC